MKAAALVALGLQAVSVAAVPTTNAVPRSESASSPEDLAKIAELAEQAFEKSEEIVKSDSDIEARNGCNWSNIKIRREWGSLSNNERIAYTNAVKCLQSKPSKYPAGQVPGAKSRFDDFVAVHINQSMTIHYTGNFLSWHRYFTWQYEKALQDECGYRGTQPYWDWGLTAITGTANSPVFDGSATSMSGNGAYEDKDADYILLGGGQSDLPPLYLPVGNGGGCVTSGPFKDMEVNLGPAALDVPGGIVESNPEGPFAYNPRCLKRDFADQIIRDFSNATATLRNILQPRNIMDFQMQMQGVPGSGSIGIHGGGHYLLGGDPARDVLVSPGDPVFYLHHSMIDRVWWIWQMLNPSKRVWSDDAIDGTNTFLNNPPSANTTLDDIIDLEFAAGPPLKIRDIMSTLHGPFCYVYL